LAVKNAGGSLGCLGRSDFLAGDAAVGSWLDSEEFWLMKTRLERITVNAEICGGKPCIRGTRIWVSLILDFLADGMTEGELLAEYPQLVHEDVLAAIAYGAEASRERVVLVPIDQVA